MKNEKSKFLKNYLTERKFIYRKTPVIRDLGRSEKIGISYFRILINEFLLGGQYLFLMNICKIQIFGLSEFHFFGTAVKG